MKGFDRYMVAIGIGTHPKFARLTDSEFRAHIAGVLAVAALAPERGCLLVGKLRAESVDVARAAGVSERSAASAMRKLEAVGVLYEDEKHGCLRVHDWDDANPAESSSAARMRRLREGTRDAKASNGDAPRRHKSDAKVTRK